MDDGTSCGGLEREAIICAFFEVGTQYAGRWWQGGAAIARHGLAGGLPCGTSRVRAGGFGPPELEAACPAPTPDPHAAASELELRGVRWADPVGRAGGSDRCEFSSASVEPGDAAATNVVRPHPGDDAVRKTSARHHLAVGAETPAEPVSSGGSGAVNLTHAEAAHVLGTCSAQ